MTHQEMEKNAGGMSYRTLPEIETSLITQYLDSNDNESTIFEKNKKYYLASADKTIARLELAKIRVQNSDMHSDECQLVLDKINNGLHLIECLKNQIKTKNHSEELQKATAYKMWHAVKLIPSSAEGYAILSSLEKTMLNSKGHESKNKLKTVEIHLKDVKKIFSNLLNLDESSDFAKAEKYHLKAYEKMGLIQKMLNDL
jgi:hypothetical protein